MLRALRSRLAASTILAIAAVPLLFSFVQGADPSQEELADGIAFRASVGFPHSEDVVRSSYENSAEYTDMTWGVPLSDAEAAEMIRRVRIRSGQAEAVEYAKSQPDYGGLWFDQMDRGAAHYTFTPRVDEHRSRILELVPAEADVHVTQVAHSMAKLDGVKANLTEDMLALIDDGLPIATVDAHSRSNRVVVSLWRPVDGAEAMLRNRYGDTVVTAVGPRGFPDCNGSPPFDRGNCRPMKGGLRIEHYPDDGDCSAAFQAVRTNGQRVLITAGHCLDGVSGTRWDHNGSEFGQAQGDSINASSVEADIGWILLTDSDTTPRNRYLKTSWSDVHAFDGQASDASQTEGDTVCRRGEQSHYDCGLITRDDVSKPNGAGQTITSVWEWDRDSLGGDSGGTMVVAFYQPGPNLLVWLAAGLHIHSYDNEGPCNDNLESGPDACLSWYSTADQVEDSGIMLGVQMYICLTSYC